MRLLIIGAAALVLVGCKQEAPADDAATAEAEPAAESAMASVGGPGAYEVTYADGTTGTLTSTADNTFTATRGEETINGTVSETDGKVCFDIEGDDTEARCWTNSAVGEDGSWTSTADDGEVVTVKPAAS